MWSNFIRFMAPARCRLCHAPTPAEGLCRDCRARLPRPARACPQCALPLPAGSADALCGECLSDPPAFDRAHVPLLYSPPLDGLIAGLKYHGRLAHARLLIEAFGPPPAGPPPDCLIPVPLHPARLRTRGFNQAAELARLLAERAGLPWDGDSLVRIRAAPAQRASGRRQRLRNVRGAFAWRGRAPCPPRVALVDDVVTTGATARAAAACLKRAGAQWVEIWAVARTPENEGRRTGDPASPADGDL